MEPAVQEMAASSVAGDPEHLVAEDAADRLPLLEVIERGGCVLADPAAVDKSGKGQKRRPARAEVAVRRSPANRTQPIAQRPAPGLGPRITEVDLDVPK